MNGRERGERERREAGEKVLLPAEQSLRFIDEEKKWRFGSFESGDFLSRKLMHEFTSNNG